MRNNAAMLLVVVLATAGCRRATQSNQTLLLATTTSTRDSGLLDVLLPLFEQQAGITVKVVAVGSGQALEMGRRGDADVLLTHAPAAEEEFVRSGHGLRRVPLMYNDFLIVGPGDDPAQVRNCRSAAEAFRQIARARAPFVSRGDESGTHIREKQIWRQANLTPDPPWYLSTGSGMAQTLRVASKKRAYTLVDRATFLAQKSQLQLAPLLEGDPVLRNHYAVIAVNPRKHPHVNHRAAEQFIRFLTAGQTRRIIAQFGKQQFGQALFHPVDEPPR